MKSVSVILNNYTFENKCYRNIPQILCLNHRTNSIKRKHFVYTKLALLFCNLSRRQQLKYVDHSG